MRAGFGFSGEETLTPARLCADTRAKMSDTFSFEAASRPLRRRVDPRAMRAAVAAFVIFCALGMFARWVIGSERASQRAPSGIVPSSLAATSPSVDAAGSAAVAGDPAADAAAQRVADRAATAAHRLFDRTGSFAEAGPAQLSSAVPAYSFVDGPSPATLIVSVAGGLDVWGADALRAVDPTW